MTSRDMFHSAFGPGDYRDRRTENFDAKSRVLLTSFRRCFVFGKLVFKDLARFGNKVLVRKISVYRFQGFVSLRVIVKNYIYLTLTIIFLNISPRDKFVILVKNQS